MTNLREPYEVGYKIGFAEGKQAAVKEILEKLVEKDGCICEVDDCVGQCSSSYNAAINHVRSLLDHPTSVREKLCLAKQPFDLDAPPAEGKRVKHSELVHCPNCVFPPNYNCDCSCHKAEPTNEI